MRSLGLPARRERVETERLIPMMNRFCLMLALLGVYSCVQFKPPDAAWLLSKRPVPVIEINGPSSVSVNSVVDITVKVKGLCAGRPDSGFRGVLYLPTEANKRTESTSFRVEEFFEWASEADACHGFKDEYSVVYRVKFSERGKWEFFSDNSVLKSRYQGYEKSDEIPNRPAYHISVD